jgi:hypothetical protein
MTPSEYKEFKALSNSAMGAKQVRECFQLDADSKGCLEHAMEQMDFSAKFLLGEVLFLGGATSSSQLKSSTDHLALGTYLLPLLFPCPPLLDLQSPRIPCNYVLIETVNS